MNVLEQNPVLSCIVQQLYPEQRAANMSPDVEFWPYWSPRYASHYLQRGIVLSRHMWQAQNFASDFGNFLNDAFQKAFKNVF